jgi:hypothetical protein
MTIRPTLLQRLQGRTRIAFGFCPACNSDAPEVYDCKVCEGWQSVYEGVFPPPQATRDRWWRRFTMAKCTHGYPMEDRCPECSGWLHDHLQRHLHSVEHGNPRQG